MDSLLFKKKEFKIFFQMKIVNNLCYSSFYEEDCLYLFLLTVLSLGVIVALYNYEGSRAWQEDGVILV